MPYTFSYISFLTADLELWTFWEILSYLSGPSLVKDADKEKNTLVKGWTFMISFHNLLSRPSNFQT